MFIILSSGATVETQSTVDTSADHSFISIDLVQRANIPLQPLSHSFAISETNKVLTHRAKIQFSIGPPTGDNIETGWFYVLKGLESDIIIGSRNIFKEGLLSQQGKYAEAEAFARETLQLREKVLGKEHPDTLTSMNSLADWLRQQGKYDTAEPLYRETLQLREKVLGKEHPDTLKSMHDLASLYHSQGKYDAAEPLYRETLQLTEKVLGKEHPDTLKSMHDLASLYHSQGKYDAAEPLYRETLQLREKVLGKEHPDTLTSRNRLASSLYHQGK